MELNLCASDVVVGRWSAPASNTYGLPAGTFSWGVWPLKDAVWGAYRVHSPDGALLKYRFDALELPYVEEHTDGELQLVFHDLLLDFTVTAGDKGEPVVLVEDEDEVEQAVAQDSLKMDQLNKIRQFQAEFEAAPNAFLNSVDEAIATALRGQQHI